MNERMKKSVAAALVLGICAGTVGKASADTELLGAITTSDVRLASAKLEDVKVNATPAAVAAGAVGTLVGSFVVGAVIGAVEAYFAGTRPEPEFSEELVFVGLQESLLD